MGQELYGQDRGMRVIGVLKMNFFKLFKILVINAMETTIFFKSPCSSHLWMCK